MAVNSLRIVNTQGSMHATRKSAFDHRFAWHVFCFCGQRRFQGGTIAISRVPVEI